MTPPPHPIRNVDFYVEPDGWLGIAWVSKGDPYMDLVNPDPRPGTINTQRLEEYLDEHFGRSKDGAKQVAQYFADLGFVRPDQAPWPLPKRPDTPLEEWEAQSDMGDLLSEISAYVGEHLRLPEKASARSIAAWVLASAVPEIASHAPPLTFLGPPNSGKSRGLRVLRMIARRAMSLGVPSPASLYALTDLFQPVLLVDEWSHLAPEIRRAVESVIRLGFDRGGTIPRRREHSEGVRFWKAFGFFALGTKEPLADDLMDRALPFFMQEARDVPDLPQDDPEGLELRTAVLRYRLEALAGTSPRLPVTDGRARVIMELGDRRLSDRGLDKAQVLAAIAMPYGAVEEVVEAVLDAQEAARAQYGESTEALVYRALVRLAEGKPLKPDIEITVVGPGQTAKFSLKDVHDDIWEELITQHGYTFKQLENRDPVLPERLGPLLRVMGFEVRRGGKGVRYVDDTSFQAKLTALASKYGSGP